MNLAGEGATKMGTDLFDCCHVFFNDGICCECGEHWQAIIAKNRKRNVLASFLQVAGLLAIIFSFILITMWFQL